MPLLLCAPLDSRPRAVQGHFGRVLLLLVATHRRISPGHSLDLHVHARPQPLHRPHTPHQTPGRAHGILPAHAARVERRRATGERAAHRHHHGAHRPHACLDAHGHGEMLHRKETLPGSGAGSEPDRERRAETRDEGTGHHPEIFFC